MSRSARYYEILGLDPGASLEDVKQAWRDLAQVWHPDRFGDNERLRTKAQEKLKEINEAYQVLREQASGTGAAGGSSEPRSSPTNVAWERADGDSATILDLRELLLEEGVHAWNLWRKKYSDVRPALKGINLRRANLAGADFREADLTEAILLGADLYKANLSAAKLQKAKLATADLSRATLIDTNLSRADLERANLSGADLSGAVLVNAVLSGVILVGASLEGADLSGATGLTREQIAETIMDGATRLPTHLKATPG